MLTAHLAPGFLAAVDMLTRTSETSNFAPDASVYPAARDPATGGRQLEELAFEIADAQPLPDAGEKARELVARGVRRVFCLAVKQSRVLEWSRETDNWRPLHPETTIEDPCFVRAIPLRALVDAAAADESVVAALDARRHPAILAIEARGHEKGREEGREEGRLAHARAALQSVLRARGLKISRAESAKIGAERDLGRLDRWLTRAVTAASTKDVLGSR